MTSIADGSVNIQTTSESHVSIPSCFGEVVVISRYLQKHKVLNKINGQVRFARKRFGRYEFIDFLAVLFGYAISGERTLEEFYQRLQLFAAPFMTLFERDRLPSRSALSVILTWVFNHTRGSLLLTMLGHASFNTATSLALPPSLASISFLGRWLCSSSWRREGVWAIGASVTGQRLQLPTGEQNKHLSVLPKGKKGEPGGKRRTTGPEALKTSHTLPSRVELLHKHHLYASQTHRQDMGQTQFGDTY